MARHPGNLGIMGRKRLTDLRISTLREWLALVPPEWVRSWNKASLTQEWKNGSVVMFRPLDDPMKVHSTNLGFFGVDEVSEVSEEMFRKLKSRLRHPKIVDPRGFGACNPEDQFHYLYKLFVGPNRTTEIRAKHAYYNATSFDTHFTADEYKQDLRITYSGSDYRRYVLGEWCGRDNRIWNNFDPDLNVIPHPKLDRSWRYDLSIDFGFVHDFVCLWGAWDFSCERPRLIVYRSYFRNRTTLEEHARAIRDLSKEEERQGLPTPENIWADHDEQDRYELENLPTGLRLSTSRARKHRAQGFRSVNAGFLRSYDGWPRIFITDHPSNEKLVEQVLAYARPEKEQDPREDAEVEYSSDGTSIVDGCHALRYLWYSRVAKHFEREANFDPGMSEAERQKLYRRRN